MSIDVTDEEVDRVARYLRGQPVAGNTEGALRLAFAELERIRRGDSIGTVRRSPSGLTHAIKANVVHSAHWVSDHKVNDRFWHKHEYVKDWTVVYTPEVGK